MIDTFLQLHKNLSLRTLFVDFNAYFASVEQQVRPELRGRPVGVVPVMAESSCCIAASYEAKGCGIKTGTGVREARQLCPGIVIVEARPALYVQYHQKAVAAVDTVAPVRQVLSIDEMECELTGRFRQLDRAVQLAEQIKHIIRRDVGEHLRVSIGIAPNTLLGKLASDMQKPDGLTIIEPHQIPAAFIHLPVNAISGIGPRMSQRLASECITSMQALFDAPRSQLHRVWGGVGGAEMYDKLRGAWYEPRTVQTQSLGHSHVLPPELRSQTGAYGVLTRLVQKAAMRLRRQGFYATAMTVQVRCVRPASQAADAPRLGAKRECRFGETQDTSFFLHSLETLWSEIMASQLFWHARPLSVGMVFGGLVPQSQHTASLFDLPAQSGLRDSAKLHRAIDQLNVQYGKNTLYYAASHASLDRAPMRIAFTRIPDLETEI
jgi:DNA polymerase IV